MSEELFVRLCAPTLAGMKTGNLFAMEYRNRQEVFQELRRFNRTLVPKGFRAVVLGFGTHRAQVYVYRPSRLRQDLGREEARNMLSSLGYDPDRPENCLRRLSGRIRESTQFPHEIGLFLSYPPEDVQGFVEQGPDRCKCVGCWKVYGDVERAKKIFCRYKQCTEVYCRCVRSGIPLEKLAVAG